MPVSPLGSVIYTNQNTQAASVKQSDVQNRVDMQNIAAGASANAKGKEVREVRPTEATYKIDPEKDDNQKRKVKKRVVQKKKRLQEIQNTNI